MKNFWLIILVLPVLVIPSLFLGFELPLYLSMGLVGLSLWLYEEDPAVNFLGNQLARAGFILFIVAFLYYFFSGGLFATHPFEFRFLRTFIEFFIGFWMMIANLIGSAVLSVMPS